MRKAAELQQDPHEHLGLYKGLKPQEYEKQQEAENQTPEVDHSIYSNAGLMPA